MIYVSIIDISMIYVSMIYHLCIKIMFIVVQSVSFYLLDSTQIQKIPKV